MIILANFMIAIANLLGMMLSAVIFIVIIQAFLSWVNPDPYNPIVRFLNSTTEPLLRPLRRYIPPIGGRIDITPIILLFGLYFLQYFLVQTILDYANFMRLSALRVAP